MRATLTPPYVPPPPVPPPVPDVRVQAPLVYVQPVWEYKRLIVDTPPSEAELNALGAEGWELVGVAPVAQAVQLYFKRMVR